MILNTKKKTTKKTLRCDWSAANYTFSELMHFSKQGIEIKSSLGVERRADF